MTKTYWTARHKVNGAIHGVSQASGPKLYSSEKMARARLWYPDAYDYIEVRVVVA